MSRDVSPMADKIVAEEKPVRAIRIHALPVLFCLLLPLCLAGQTAAPAANGMNDGTMADLHSDQRVVQNGRWFLVRAFTIQFAVRDAQQSYCGELSTTDATEAHDLISSRGQPVEVAERGRDLEVVLKSGRHIRAHRLSPDRCPRS
jgi:hypothetical protein